MLVRGVLEAMRVISASMMGENDCGGRGGRSGCGDVVSGGREAVMRDWAAVRAEGVGSGSM